MRRYHTELTVIASIGTILLLLWGLDLTHSIAEDQPAGSYRADVNVWTDGSFLNLLQKTSAVNHHNINTCMIIFRSERGMLVWKHIVHPGNPDHQQIRLSHQTDGAAGAGCVVLVTFWASESMDKEPGNLTILIHEVLIGSESSLVVLPPARISLPISFPFGG